MPADPAYLRIAADLRRCIVDGSLGPGAKLPTESELMRAYGVSRTVAKYSINVLKDEGLVEGRQGSGVYVRSVPRLVRHGPGGSGGRTDARGPQVPPDGTAAGRWQQLGTGSAEAPAGVAERLGIEPGSAVVRRRYRFLVADEPVQLLTSWEPGDPGQPDPRGSADPDPVARLAARGLRVDECVEEVCDRAATPEEIKALKLSLRGGRVQSIQRTYVAAGRPVETADIVLVAARYELIYRLPIAPPPAPER